MQLLVQWLIYAAAIMLSAYLLPGIAVRGVGAAFITALVLGFFNAILRPVVLLLTLPLTIVTLGLFILVVNTLLIMLTGAVVPGFEVRNFWWALLFGIILSLVHSFFNLIAFG